MPKRNCPQSNSWCPHYHPDMCRDVEEGEHDVCVHVRAALAPTTASLGAVMAFMIAREQRLLPEIDEELIARATRLMTSIRKQETRQGPHNSTERPTHSQ